jgi:hypothetical protein
MTTMLNRPPLSGVQSREIIGIALSQRCKLLHFVLAPIPEAMVQTMNETLSRPKSQVN